MSAERDDATARTPGGLVAAGPIGIREDVHRLREGLPAEKLDQPRRAKEIVRAA